MSRYKTPQSGESTGSEDLQAAIGELIEEFEFLHELRIQKLLYIADLVAQLERGERITDADFKPYMYGSYSEEISNTLSQFEDKGKVEYSPDYQYGDVTTKYTDLTDGEETTLSDEKAEEILERVKDATEGWTSQDLGEWSKESWLYKNTNYGSEMDFDRLDPVKTTVADELESTFDDLDIDLDDNSS